MVTDIFKVADRLGMVLSKSRLIKISTTRPTGGIIRAISPYYRLTSKGASFPYFRICTLKCKTHKPAWVWTLWDIHFAILLIYLLGSVTIVLTQPQYIKKISYYMQYCYKFFVFVCNYLILGSEHNVIFTHQFGSR